MVVRRLLPCMLGLGLALGLGGCDRDMVDQPRLEDQEGTSLFADKAVVQPPVAGTVARGELARRQALEERPELTAALVERGRQRFDIYCSPCHGRTGAGNGMVVQRGFPAPPSLIEGPVVSKPPRHVVEVITQGTGDMFSYADRVAPGDRWAIAAYVEALQLSRRVPLSDLGAEARARVRAMPGGGQ